ncbi:tetratricopeptide repeat protein [Psychromonas sp. B3M02]|uniref:tetratricopeptide repeat protein n=1 Tax=Psychromonas sp. B3M02 TaxID=2267226 RepID=UPI000DE92CE0|nr:tetratricopeptide repeat protein [Psychromonas sp. B3M02]RBW42452.1 tetratricopeptide repeat protein [Psychromonas sp. B3M02]
MHSWEILTKRANKAYSSNDFSDAVFLNQQALSMLETTFHDNFLLDAESYISAAAVSFLNLADAYNALNNSLLANSHYENAINFLQAVLSRADVDDRHYCLVMHTVTRIRCEWEMFNEQQAQQQSVQDQKSFSTFVNHVPYAEHITHH